MVIGPFLKGENCFFFLLKRKETINFTFIFPVNPTLSDYFGVTLRE